MTRRKKEPPRRWRVTVKRMQVWDVEVEADTEEEAMEAAEAEARESHPNDDYGYETRAREVR